MKHQNIYKEIMLYVFVIFLFTSCESEVGPSSTTTTWIRVFDLRYNSDSYYLSAFTWDGHFYGNPNLDTVSRPPARVLESFGDFSLGRSLVVESQGTLEEAYDYNGPIDYSANSWNNNEFGVLGSSVGLNGQPYRQGDENPSRAISFPNLTHRIPVGTIRNDIDYYKWAVFPAGMHSVSFTPILKSNLTNRFRYSFDSFEFINKQFYFKPDGIYSLFLLRSFTLDTSSKDCRLLKLQEDPSAVFEPTHAYIRFVNAIPLTGDNSVDVLTESIDIYMQEVDSKEVLELSKTVTEFDIRFLKPLSSEKLVVSNLQRFETNGVVPYVGLDFSEFILSEDTTRTTAAQSPTYVFFAYPRGESQATRHKPLKDFTFFMSNTDLFGFYSIYPLAKTASGFAPTISTVLLGTDEGKRGMYYNMEQASVRKTYLDAVSRDK
jgi:hypothetical protein